MEMTGQVIFCEREQTSNRNCQMIELPCCVNVSGWEVGAAGSQPPCSWSNSFKNKIVHSEKELCTVQ